MPRKILVINGHPDPSASRLAAALSQAYMRGAQASGHEVRQIHVGSLDFPSVITGEELNEAAPPVIQQAQDDMRWADHITIIYPLWLAYPPALLKSFFEQICRYGFVFDEKHRPLLKGRTARLIVTSIVPAIVFRLLFSQGTKGFIRGILWSAGIKPTKVTSLGNVMTADKSQWLLKVEALGRAGA